MKLEKQQLQRASISIIGREVIGTIQYPKAHRPHLMYVGYLHLVESSCPLRLYAVCAVSVAMGTGEVPARAGEAEAGVGESPEGGGRGGAQVPRGGAYL